MIYYDKEISNKIYSNEKFELLQGYLGEKEAKLSLIEFLHNNLGMTVFWLTGGGIRLFPYQEVMLRGWFDHNFNYSMVSRGGAKSFLAAVFCWLYLIFNPGTRIVLASNVFRSTRRIIASIERMVNHRDASLLRACFELEAGKVKTQRRNDEWMLPLNDGFIKALPLNEKLRGERADILITDEFLQIPEDIYKSVLMPFLTAKSNITEALKNKEIEDALIETGQITEEERDIVTSDKKIIALTSAPYDFEFAAKLYYEWIEKITKPELNGKSGRSYFVTRLSYKALPKELVEKEIIEEAANGGEETAAFQREFMAWPASTSDGYFNIKKLNEHTVKNGDIPCVQIRGNPNSKYIVSVDPNFSSSSSSDMFGIQTWLLNEDSKSITLVNNYGKPGGNLNDHLEYFYYILKNFNVVFVIADLAGEGEGNNFVSTANTSNLFMKNNLKLDFIKGDLDKEGLEYTEELKIAKNSYNLSNKRIVYRQVYGSEWIRRGNEHLQAQIEYGKIKFASPLQSVSSQFEKVINEECPIKYKDNKTQKELGIGDFIDLQDSLINETKKQIGLIEVRASAGGALQFDLPQHLKRSKSADRSRRDLYSCSLMATWGAKLYFDMLNFEPPKINNYNFSPILLR